MMNENIFRYTLILFILRKYAKSWAFILRLLETSFNLQLLEVRLDCLLFSFFYAFGRCLNAKMGTMKSVLKILSKKRRKKSSYATVMERDFHGIFESKMLDFDVKI